MLYTILSVKAEFPGIPRSLRRMLYDPPERQKYVHFRFQWCYFKDFSCVVLPMLEDHRTGVFLSRSWYEFTGEIPQGYFLFVR